MSEILESVLQTVQKNKNSLHIDSTKQNKKQKQFTYRQYIFTDCTEDNVQNTHTHTQYTQCTIKTVDSCAKVQQIIHMQCRGCALYGIQ